MKKFSAALLASTSVLWSTAAGAQSIDLNTVLASCQVDPEGCVAALETLVDNGGLSADEVDLLLAILANELLDMANGYDGEGRADLARAVIWIANYVRNTDIHQSEEIADAVRALLGEGDVGSEGRDPHQPPNEDPVDEGDGGGDQGGHDEGGGDGGDHEPDDHHEVEDEPHEASPE